MLSNNNRSGSIPQTIKVFFNKLIRHRDESLERLRLISALRYMLNRFIDRSPARLTLYVFIFVILVFTLLLMLPFSSATGEFTPLHEAFFTAVSSVCVTGLTTVNTAMHWSPVGQSLILIGVQTGGIGIVTLASIIALTISRTLSVRSRFIAQGALNNASKLGEVGSLLKTVVITSATIELMIALVLFPQFLAQGEPTPNALFHAIFYAISSFNNAGFTPHSNGLVPYEFNLLILIPLMVGVFLGSLGFPVLMVMMRKKWHASKWNLHTKITVLVMTILLLAGTLLWAILEWNNSKTIAGMSVGEKITHSLFASTMMRSGGFNLVDQANMNSVTLLLTDALMFAGGGSASTAGGIKVTTLAIVFLTIIAEARGEKDINAFHRNIPIDLLRISLSVIALGATLVMVGSGIILTFGFTNLDEVLFEVISAFATVGLSVGLTEKLPIAGTYVLAFMMFAGRIGTITLAAALTLRKRKQFYKYPHERPIIG